MNTQKFIKCHLLQRSWLSYCLYPLSLLYALLLWGRRKFKRASFPAKDDKIIIASVGNIVSGGTGKTPFTLFLANYFTQRGLKIAVSHRGYRGLYEKSEKIISDYVSIYPEAKNAGDEACFLAHALPGVPVVVGKNRTKAIQLLKKRFSNLELVILDDSFQHLRVKKHLNFVLFNEISGMGNGFVLPAGFLREPLSALRDATALVVNGWVNFPAWVNKPILHGGYQVKGIYKQGNKVTLEEMSKRKIVLLSGIGNPASFEKTVSEYGLTCTRHLAYPDHYAYTQLDLKTIQKTLANDEIILTTEKDWVKLQEFTDEFYILKICYTLKNVELLASLTENYVITHKSN